MKEEKQMGNENKISLVALVEQTYGISTEPIFKIINFLPDFKVKKIYENGLHKKNSQGQYCFDIIHKDIFQIPYVGDIKNLSVIVGENGAGKTTIINQILRGGKGKSLIHLIFKQNDKFWTYPDFAQEAISIQHCSTHPYIIKFSNAKEFPSGDIYIRPGALDASNFKNIIAFDKDEKIVILQETINQIKFIEEFKHKINEFVDYSQKGVTVDFEGDKLPYKSDQLLYLDRVEKLTNRNDKNSINHRIVDYFSTLINYIIDKEYTESDASLINYENLLALHLSFRNNENIILQYQSIRVDSDRFLPFEYSIGGLRQDVSNIQLKDTNIDDRVDIWHIFYIINLYFNYVDKTKVGSDNKYYKEISSMLDELEKKVQKLRYTLDFSNSELNKLDNLIRQIQDIYRDIYRGLFEEFLPRSKPLEKWSKLWESIKAPCIRVAKAISYTSYFELTENGYFVKHKLIPERVWTKLKEVRISDNEIERLKDVEELLYKLQEINTDFKILSKIVSIISEISIPALEESLQFRWIGLSSGELGLLRSFANLYSAKLALQRKTHRGIDQDNFLILLDEVDQGMHPEWQRKWVSTALPIIEKIFDNKHLQIIITTHSPIFLSDIYKENIIYLSKDNTGYENNKFNKTFGQNIYTLYKNSFFLNRLMGEYAYKSIEDTFEYLNFKINADSKGIRPESLFNELSDNLQKKTAQKIIESIGEPIIANQLKELFIRAFLENKDEIEEIKDKISKLQEQLKQLEEDNSK
ncbi:AAA family ATPase [Streptococcus oralis]|uniref:AAA family ATPase n=2 Tax=Streptococcus oralis TaxID=1303 RepID=UPI002001B23A|nr:AAA family ATPase [Streptococcus oralis]